MIDGANRRTFRNEADLETSTPQELIELRAARAQQRALAYAGVTAASGFSSAPVVPAPVQAPPMAESTGPTVKASQLTNGTATLQPAVDAAPAPVSPLYVPPAGADLAALTSGKDGVALLTRDQVVQTITAAVPSAAALIAQGVTDQSLASAFLAVIAARATPGVKDIAISLVGFETTTETQPNGESSWEVQVTNPSTTPTSFSASVNVGAHGQVNGTALAADQATAADYKPYPDGDSASHVKAQYEVTGDPGNLDSLMAANGDRPALDRQAIIDTVLSAAPEAKALISAGVTNDSLARAFSQIIEARKTPGEKTLSLGLVALETKTEWLSRGESSYDTTTQVAADHPTNFAAKLSVAEGGLVNGAELPADIATHITSAARNVPQEFKDATLRDVGLSEEWMMNASQSQKDYALARIVNAKQTPGSKQLDFSFGYTSWQSMGEQSQTVQLVAAGVVNLNVGADGKVNGKPLVAEVAFNATRTIEAMPAAVRRATLMSLGFKTDAISKGSSDQQKYALTKASVATASPGTTQQFEVYMGEDKYAVGIKVGASGKIEGAGVTYVPPPPKKSWWKTLVSVVCTVVSIIYPPVAIICQAIQAAIAISSGAKGLALIGAIAGAAAGVADIAGYASMAGTLSNVASTVGTVNSAINAFQSGDFLGALSGAASLGSGLGGGFGELGETLNTIGTVAKSVAGVAGAIKGGDALAMISAGANAAGTIGGALGYDVPSELHTVGLVANTARSIQSGNYAGALTGLTLLGRDTGVIGPARSSTYAASKSEPSVTTGASDVAVVDTVAASVTNDDPFGGLVGLLGSDASEASLGAFTPAPLMPIGPSPQQMAAQKIDFSDVPEGGVDAPPPATTRTVRRGDTLSKIAAATLGDANRWPEIYAYNVASLGGIDPNRVPVGAELQIPPRDFALPASTRSAMFTAAYIPAPVSVASSGGTGGGLSVFDGGNSDGQSFASLSQAQPSIFGDGSGTANAATTLPLTKTAAALQEKAAQAFKDGKVAMGIKYVTESANATIRETGARPGPIGWLMGQLVSGIAEDTATAVTGINTDGEKASEGARIFSAAMIGVNFVPGGTAAKEAVYGLKASDKVLEAAASALPKGFALSEQFRPTILSETAVHAIEGAAKGATELPALLARNFDQIAQSARVAGMTTMADLGDAARYAMPSEAAMTKSALNLPYAETVLTWAKANKIEAEKAVRSMSTYLEDVIAQVKNGGTMNVFSGEVSTIKGTVTQGVAAIQGAQLDRLLRARTELAEAAALAESGIKLKPGQTINEVRGSFSDAVTDKMNAAVAAAYKLAGRKGP